MIFNFEIPNTTSDLYMVLPGGIAEVPANGLVISVLRRAQVLRDHGMRTEILTFPFDSNFGSTVRRVGADYQFGDTISLRNPFHELSGHSYHSNSEYSDPLLASPNHDIVVDEGNPQVRRVYDDGVYIKYAWNNPFGRLVLVDHLGGGKRTHRVWHDSCGCPAKIDYMDDNNKPYRSEYIHRDGSVYLESNVDPVTAKESDLRLFVTPSEILRLRTVDDFELWWLVNVVFNENSHSMIISEYAFRAHIFEAVADERNISTIYTLHNSHLAAPYNYGSPLKNEFVDFFRRLPTFDAVVVLTDAQKFDIERSFLTTGNIHVIPHHVDAQEIAVSKKSNTVIMNSRITAEKGQLDAIQIWPQVLEEFPDVVLDIYGSGPASETAISMVRELSITESVFLHGFTPDISDKVASSSIALYPSQFEGFSLSLIEAMAVGTVPVAYDFKYGARQMIVNGVNGIIVEKSNLHELADSIKYLLRNVSYRNRLSAEATKVASQFTAAQLASNWIALFDDVHRSAVSRNT